ncbi:MAG: capsule assembly Wzi family protein [Bacteroidota bacterium]
MSNFQPYIFLGFLSLSTLSLSLGQDNDILLQHELYQYADRLQIKYPQDTALFLGAKPYGRDALNQFFAFADTSSMGYKQKAWHKRMQYLLDDELSLKQVGEGVFNTLYKNKRDFFHIQTPTVNIFINPALNLGVGRETHEFSTGISPQTLLNNSRGISIRGTLFNKIGFYSEVYDNITRFPQYQFDRYRQTDVLEGEAFIKLFGEQNGLDYLSSKAYITVSPIKNIRIKFGKDRAFWGYGHQSLALSDVATDHLLLNIRTRFWKFEYVNHFAQMIDFVRNKRDDEGTFPRKFAVFHQLTFQPNSRWSLGLFESIVYTPTLANGNRGFELSYLNPIIFYRSAEQALGSPDNSFLGLQGRVNLWKRLQLYGQLTIDDYNFGVRDQGSGYWANKYGYQLGLKYIDVLNIPSMDLQLEYNSVRPYTYQHINVSASYQHYGQSLGHAAGANLYDVTAILRYRPLPALQLYGSYTYLKQGLDENGINYGADPSISYAVNRFQDFNNTVAQGSTYTVHQLFGRASYQLWKTDAYLDGELVWREETGGRTVYLLAGLRVGIPGRIQRR